MCLLAAVTVIGAGCSSSKKPAATTTTSAASAGTESATTAPGTAGPPAASQACADDPAGNVIVNGDAETGTGATDTSSTRPLQGWTDSANITQLSWTASGGFPHKSDPGPAVRGKNLFAGGPDGDVNHATQTDDLPAGSAGKPYTLAGCLGGYADQGDHAVLTVAFLDGSGASVGTATLGPVTPADRDNTTALLDRHTQGTVPASATKARVTLTMTRVSGTYNDGYADDLSLVVAS